MEDSNLWYYIVLGAIYFLSKLFGKKKKPVLPKTEEVYDSPEEYEEAVPKSPNKPPVSFQDIFKELTGEIQKPLKDFLPNLEPILDEEQPEIKEPVLATDIVDYQKTNIERVRPDEIIDIPGHKPLHRESQKFERSEHYKIRVEENEVRDGVLELLDDHTGLQKAFVLKELLDKKY